MWLTRSGTEEYYVPYTSRKSGATYLGRWIKTQPRRAQEVSYIFMTIKMRSYPVFVFDHVNIRSSQRVFEIRGIYVDGVLKRLVQVDFGSREYIRGAL